ncbi:hypothetical protein FBQ95_16975 [Chloroflexi bacterium CFX3]|nr:hypothetical protein [Chloroflexi bacterium CFX3]
MRDQIVLSDGVYIPLYAAAERFCVTRPTLYRWAAQGTVRAAMPHRRRVYVNNADVARVATQGIRAAHAWQLPLF